MNRTPDLDLVLRDYFADDGLSAPDYVLDVVEGRIRRQSQRGAWPFPGRTFMNAYAKLAAGAAAAIVIVVAGIALLGRPSGPPGGAVSPAPSPSAAPSAPASPAASPRTGCPGWYDSCGGGAGILSAGRHATRAFKPAFTYVVPEGWINDDDEAGYFKLLPESGANRASFVRDGRLSNTLYMGPHESPWYICEEIENNRGRTAAEIAAAVAANEALTTTGMVDVTLGGLDGKQFDVQLNFDQRYTCPPNPDDPDWLELADVRVRGILLDVPREGVLAIFIESRSSANSDEFLAEARPIVESFDFDLGQ